MEATLTFLERLVARLPGPGKIMFGELIADREALRVLLACMAAIFAASLQPPYLSLYVANVEQGIRDPGSGVAIEVAAAYLLLAVLTLVGGASGDIFGHKRFMLFGLFAVMVTNILGMFLLNSSYYTLLNSLNTITSSFIMPMTIAIVTLAFPLAVRPFAYGAVFAVQGIGYVTASSLYGIFEPTSAQWVAFLPAIIMGFVAIRLVRRDTQESRAPNDISRQELLLNLAWASAIFGLVYGVLAIGGGLDSRNMFLVIGICVIGFIIAYRWVARRMRGSAVKMYDVRDLSLAILAGIMLSAGQGTLFYQTSVFFQRVQGVGPVVSGARLAPYVIALMIATLFVVRLSQRFGARRMITGGLLLMALGLGSMFFIQPTTPYWQLIVPMLIMGFGFGVSAPPRTVVVLTTPPPGLTGMAAGVNTAAGQSGFALGVVLSSILVTLFADQNFKQQLEQTNAPPQVMNAATRVFQEFFSRAMSGDLTRLPENLAQQVTLSFGNAFTVGLAMTFVVIAIILAITGVVIFLGMNKGLKGSFVTRPVGGQNAGSTETQPSP
ncbi:MAG: MFS transporter [Chloroflexota bacterium]|nr:MAG: MFS transporter [Chloroflexota bacterium]